MQTTDNLNGGIKTTPTIEQGVTAFTPLYAKKQDGLVEIYGELFGNTFALNQSNAIATIPVEYAPEIRRIFPFVVDNGAGTPVGYGWFSIDPTGVITLATTANGFIELHATYYTRIL